MLKYVVLGVSLFVLSSSVYGSPLEDQAAAKANTKVDAVVEIDKHSVSCSYVEGSKIARKTGSRIMTGRMVRKGRLKQLAKGKLACMPAAGRITERGNTPVHPMPTPMQCGQFQSSDQISNGGHACDMSGVY